MTAAGTSMANYLAIAATLEPGEEALVEHPTYELLVTRCSILGATCAILSARWKTISASIRAVERQMTPRTRLIVLTNLHNPTGAYIDEATPTRVGDIAKRHGARVLVDEVYLEAFYEKRPPAAIHLGDHFLVTSSLTKAFGLSGVRCGWVLACRSWRPASGTSTICMASTRPPPSGSASSRWTTWIAWRPGPRKI